MAHKRIDDRPLDNDAALDGMWPLTTNDRGLSPTKA
jgi:hypothetical protein